jgi:hypothetical protein
LGRTASPFACPDRTHVPAGADQQPAVSIQNELAGIAARRGQPESCHCARILCGWSGQVTEGREDGGDLSRWLAKNRHHPQNLFLDANLARPCWLG